MHVSPGPIEAAIGLLDEPAPSFKLGDIVETADPVIGKVRA
jgi:hypothetical protein